VSPFSATFAQVSVIAKCRSPSPAIVDIIGATLIETMVWNAATLARRSGILYGDTAGAVTAPFGKNAKKSPQPPNSDAEREERSV
jgi:hypothetical protein